MVAKVKKVMKQKSLSTMKGKAARKTVAKTVKVSRVSSNLRKLRAVVINLENRPDRLEALQRSRAKNAPWLKLQRLAAVDGRVTQVPCKDVVKTWSTARLAQMFHWYRDKKIKMSPGERGCCASHLKAWRQCAKSGKPLLVLEDDAVILPTFTSTLTQALKELPKNAGALWLTSKDRGTRKRVGKVLMEPHYLWTTVGYIIWPAAARALIELLPMDMPVDNFMAWHVKHHAVKAFSASPALVRQAQTWNVGSDVPHSDDVALWDAWRMQQMHPSEALLPWQLATHCHWQCAGWSRESTRGVRKKGAVSVVNWDHVLPRHSPSREGNLDSQVQGQTSKNQAPHNSLRKHLLYCYLSISIPSIPHPALQLSHLPA